MPYCEICARAQLYHENCYFTESRKVKKMPEPRTCVIRRTGTYGPMSLCKDMSCFKKCFKLTVYENALALKGD